jgi:Cft2 family RNA processing exonuclease
MGLPMLMCESGLCLASGVPNRQNEKSLFFQPVETWLQSGGCAAMPADPAGAAVSAGWFTGC